MSRDDGLRRAALEERIRLAEQDLRDLAVQVEDDEIDARSAADLEARYREDLESARSELAAIPSIRGRKPEAARPRAGMPRREGSGEEPSGGGRSGRTVLVVAAASMVALTIAIIGIASSGDPGPPEDPATMPQGSPDDAVAQLEAAVASQPDNNAMRLALAGIYFETGDYVNAMNHYATVTANDPTPEEASVANARIGWMAWVALDDPATALQFLDASIDLDPVYGEAKLWKAIVLLYGMGDGDAAVPIFEEVLSFPDLPEELRPEIEQMLAEARGGGS